MAGQKQKAQEERITANYAGELFNHATRAYLHQGDDAIIAYNGQSYRMEVAECGGKQGWDAIFLRDIKDQKHAVMVTCSDNRNTLTLRTEGNAAPAMEVSPSQIEVVKKGPHKAAAIYPAAQKAMEELGGCTWNEIQERVPDTKNAKLEPAKAYEIATFQIMFNKMVSEGVFQDAGAKRIRIDGVIGPETRAAMKIFSALDKSKPATQVIPSRIAQQAGEPAQTEQTKPPAQETVGVPRPQLAVEAQEKAKLPAIAYLLDRASKIVKINEDYYRIVDEREVLTLQDGSKTNLGRYLSTSIYSNSGRKVKPRDEARLREDMERNGLVYVPEEVQRNGETMRTITDLQGNPIDTRGFGFICSKIQNFGELIESGKRGPVGLNGQIDALAKEYETDERHGKKRAFIAYRGIFSKSIDYAKTMENLYSERTNDGRVRYYHYLDEDTRRTVRCIVWAGKDERGKTILFGEVDKDYAKQP